ncbi:alpha/beta fold hydrolase [Streptomyces sp. NPDC051001]|uniref:alpha/beta hydrolase n=1 Tax=Streptomyces sp. NPDC051001 TaxID=3155795 RepID=UPI00341A00E0
MQRDVAFSTEDGTTLAGEIHSSSATPAPGIVMAHGFSGVKSQVAHYAALFAEAGLSVLLYDHRGFGLSDGSPRNEVDPYHQLADWRDAITFASAQPEFAPEAGFGVWGSSFAGGLAIVTAANDHRVRCVVAQIPNVSGHRNTRRVLTAEELETLRTRAGVDRQARLRGESPATVPVFSNDPAVLCGLPRSVTDDYITQAERHSPTWHNEVTLRSLEHLAEFEPAGWIEHVAPKPLLMIVAEEDTCTVPDIQREVFARAGEPKQLLTHPGGHFETYTTYFKQTGPPARDWFAQHLLASV